MSELKDTPCAVCDAPVFEKGAVVVCSVCDAYHHNGCWNRTGHCSARPKCKGRAVPVAVVKLQPPGPTAAEIADAVGERTQEILHPVVADLRSAMAHAEDVESLRKTILESARTAKERSESALRELEARGDALRQLVAAADARVAALPVPAGRDDVAHAVKEIRERNDALILEASSSLEAQIAEMRRAVSAELHEVLLAVEACRWDTGARRHPLPWDTRPDEILSPRGDVAADEARNA